MIIIVDFYLVISTNNSNCISFWNWISLSVYSVWFTKRNKLCY